MYLITYLGVLLREAILGDCVRTEESMAERMQMDQEAAEQQTLLPPATQAVQQSAAPSVASEVRGQLVNALLKLDQREARWRNHVVEDRLDRNGIGKEGDDVLGVCSESEDEAGRRQAAVYDETL